ncbi:ABC transporter permease [Aminobacter anthyllidis]|uniref:ABC transporter permease n=1 Tax=Aminobacter anthyllidis TaxID=1035067 RepID=UPI002453AA0F|nr:ABC transporter permease [Aminobacter anthyllidis]MDH4986523.1 ABC transporter permease [Aminobacter anthyllidis]
MSAPGLTMPAPIGAFDNSAVLRRDRKLEQLGYFGLAVPAVLLVTIAIVVPLAAMFWISIARPDGSVSLDTYLRILSTPVYTRSVLTTFQVSGMTVLTCALLGTPFALVMASVGQRLASILLLVVMLPFWTALLVRTYALSVLLQRNGLVNSFLIDTGLVSEPLPLINNFFGTIVGMTHVMLPLFILPVYAAIKQIDHNVIRAAASLGASKFLTLRAVILPLAANGIFAGAVLVFVLSLGFYVTPAILGGGRVPMISTRIEQNVSVLSDWPAASALGVLLLLSVGLVFLVTFLLRRSIKALGGSPNV